MCAGQQFNSTPVTHISSVAASLATVEWMLPDLPSPWWRPAAPRNSNTRILHASANCATGEKAVVTALVRRVSSSEKLQPPARSLYNVAGACEAAGRFSWQRLRRWMHCNVPPQPAWPLQFSGSGIHPWMGILSRLVLTTPPLSPAGAPGIGETRRTLLSPPSSPDPVRLATGILRGAHFETLVFPALSRHNPVRPSLEADAGVWQTRL